MLEWLDNNDTLMYSTHNEGKSIIAKRFTKTWKSKIYRRMTVNCLLYHSSINKILFNNDFSALTKKMKQVMKLLHSKQTIELELISIRVFFSNGYNGNCWREVFIIDSVLKTNPWTYKLKYLNREKTIGSFSEKELFSSILLMSYYPEVDSHIRDKVKVVLDLSNYATEIELEQAASFGTSDLAAKKILLVWKLLKN